MTNIEHLILENQLVIMTLLRNQAATEFLHNKVTEQITTTEKYIGSGPIHDPHCYMIRDYANNPNGETYNYKYTCSNCKGFIGHDLSLNDIGKLDKCPHCGDQINKEYFKVFFQSSPIYRIDGTTFPRGE